MLIWVRGGDKLLNTLILLICIGIIIFVPFVRFCLMQLPKFAYYAPVDIYNYFRYKKYNECPNFGYIKVYCATPIKRFGCGKTLSATDVVIDIYRRYNGLKIWSSDMNAWITQKITIVSNIKLYNVPYVQFISERQFIDMEASPGEVLVFLIDEIGTVWNNRDFKSFNPDVFNNIVQSRKRKMSIYGTLPVFAGTDINIRRYTDKVYICEKTWRIIKHMCFVADQLEYCSNVAMLQPVSIDYTFVTNRKYNQYDTAELVDKLVKDMKSGNLLTFNELQDNSALSPDIKLAKLKRKFKKRQR